ncbi:MAG: outer membrane beta-barrel protein [Bacteroidia bacterium]
MIKFNTAGFKTGWSQIITVDSLSQISLNPYNLKAEGVNLREISVSTMKPIIELKNGSVIMNIENNILSGGNTVFEILKRVPGVSIDAQNNITVNGRGGVRFLLNGKLQQIPTSQMINLLMGMSAESVSYIELIKNPPAKYDASGSGGLINIVLKKAKLKGFSGSLAQSASQGDYARAGTFVSLNYKSNKLTVFANLTYSYLHFETKNYFLRSIKDSTSTFQLLSQGKQTPLHNNLFLNGGIEYDVNEKTSIELNVNGSSGTITNQENAQEDIIGGNPYAYNYIKFNIGTQQTIFNPSVILSATHKLDSLTQVQFSTDYTNYNEQFSRFTTNHYYNNTNLEVLPINRFGSTINNNFNIYTQNLDFTKEFKKSSNLDAGLKSSFVDNGSNANVQLTDPSSGQLYSDTSYSNHYRYHERILAGYFTLGKKIKSWEAKAGLRSEYTLIDANNLPKPYRLHRDYINFFPSGSINYELNKKNSLLANYSYRIDRPSYDQMNPATVFNDPFSKGTGNPILKPQYSHYLNLDYTFDNFITVSAAYQQTNNMIYYYSYGNPRTNVTIDTVFNYPQRNNASLSLFLQKQIKWFSFNLYNVGMYRNFKGSVNGTTANSETFQFMTNFTFEFALPKKFKLQLQGFYSSGFKEGVQYYYPVGDASITVSKTIIDKKLDISLSLFDVFRTDYEPNTNQVGGQYSYYVERNDTRRFRIYIIWKFGKMKINPTVKRSNAEESGRLKSVN